jgi:hypothetical protein
MNMPRTPNAFASRRRHSTRWLVALCLLLPGITPLRAQWIKSGSNSPNYETGVDDVESIAGEPSGYLVSRSSQRGFGTLMRQVDAFAYRGQRVRLSALVKTQDAVQAAQLWMRVNRDQQMTAFDNMGDRPLKGTVDWTRCEIVLDVDRTATQISLGVLLITSGKVWINSVRLETVSTDVPVTDLLRPPPPRNLDFEEVRQ